MSSLVKYIREVCPRNQQLVFEHLYSDGSRIVSAVQNGSFSAEVLSLYTHPEFKPDEPTQSHIVFDFSDGAYSGAGLLVFPKPYLARSVCQQPIEELYDRMRIISAPIHKAQLNELASNLLSRLELSLGTLLD